MNLESLAAPVKKHPALIIGAVGVGAVVLYMIYRSQTASVATTSGGASGPDPNSALAASTQLQEAQLQLSGQSQQIGGQLALAQLQGQNDLNLATLQASVSSLNIADQFDLAKYQTDAQTQVANKTLNTQVDLATLTNNLQEHIADVNSQTAIFSISSSADLQKTLAGLQAGVVTSVAQINAGVSLAQIASQTQIAQILAKEQTDIAKSNANTQNIGNVLGFLGHII